MTKAKKLTSISWKAKSYLADVELLDRLVEFTYFRLLQGIYLSQNQFPDDDVVAARFCKCKSVREYRAHKAILMQSRGIDPETGLEISPRIYVFEGKIRSEKCDEQLGHASKLRAQKSGAGKSSANNRAKTSKLLKDKKTRSTSVATDGSTADPTAQATAEATAASTAASTAGQPPLTLNPKAIAYPTPTPSTSDTAPAAPRSPSEVWEAKFDLFWKAYPSRGDARNPKKPAKDRFIALCKRGEDPDAIIAAAARYASAPSTKVGTQYVATAIVWLNQEGWKDDAPSPAASAPAAPAVPAKIAHVPTVVSGFAVDTQLEMARGYFLEVRRDGTYGMPKPREKRRWAYENPKTHDKFPGPLQPGCPVVPEVFAFVAAEHRITWPDQPQSAPPSPEKPFDPVADMPPALRRIAL